MNEQLESLLRLKENAQRILDEHMDRLHEWDYYTCFELCNDSLVDEYTLEKISIEFSDILRDRLPSDRWYMYSSAFINMYVTRLPVPRDREEDYKNTRIEWLNFIINYPES